MLSILISAFERVSLTRRVLWSINEFRPSQEFEVVICDESPHYDILRELRRYDFPWKYVKFCAETFEKETGVKKFFNNPSATNNIAFKQSRGEVVCLQGNEVLATPKVYYRLLASTPKISTGEYHCEPGVFETPREIRIPQEHFIVFSTTLDIPEEVVDKLDYFGENFTQEDLQKCYKFPLASPTFHTDVTNYLCLKSRKLWETVGGYDERYLCGIGKEDSDFIRRCRKVPGWLDKNNMVRSTHLSLHQYHGGRTWWYNPKPNVITQEKWTAGERLSKTIWDQWDGTHENKQPWPWGQIGVVDVISSFQS